MSLRATAVKRRAGRVAFVAGLVLVAFSVAAAAYPVRPITLVLPFPAGGVTDFAGRLLAQHLGETLGQNMVVENRAGASTRLAAEHVAKAPKDGYTLLFAAGSTLASNPHLYKNLGYRVEDFAPVSLVITLPYVISARPGLPPSIPEFVALARAKPGVLNYGNVGIGSTSHLAAEILADALAISLTDIAYRGSAAALNDLAAGRLDLLVDTLTTSKPQHEAGRLHILGVMAERRIGSAPEIPTFAEHGYPGAVAGSWFGLVAPAGTPPPVIERLNAAVVGILRRDDVRARYIAAGTEPAPGTPEAFAAFIRADAARWGAVIRRLGVQLE